MKALLRKYKVSVAALIETKVKEMNSSRILQNLGNWKFVGNYTYAHNGRIWLIWNSAKVSVACLSVTGQLVHCRITDLENSDCFLASFIYAANIVQERVSLWADIRSISGGINEPWIIVGDLNTTLYSDERIQHGNPVEYNTSELSSLVEDLGIVDLRYTGCKLTWCNNHDYETRLYCKLDRALVNDEWLNRFDASEAIFLPPETSDYCPCLIRTRQDIFMGNYLFRFCNMWIKNPNFSNILATSWATPIIGTPMYRAVKRLKVVKQGLQQLHRAEVENIFAKVNVAKGKMEHTQELVRADPGNRQLISLERTLRNSYQELLGSELELFRQKVKSEWLTLMDTNSPYFHA